MVWCNNCATNISRPNYDSGKICCSICGKVLDEDNFSQEATFVKNAAGQSQLSGNFVRTVQNEYSLSRERILNEAYDGIESVMHALDITGGESIARPALAFYTIAVERNFTRGRRKELVVSACLYITCRENNKPFLLIDFSEHLRVNVYVLGAVFLQLCQLLSLGEHPIVQKPVDPSLFIHRFTNRLFGDSNPSVSRTALQIVASMKRDWMQTGRKPSGLCGAALYISALSHGLKCSKSDVMKVVHVCEATLTKRLIEFENTESGGLTIEEFNVRAEELEREGRSLIKSLDGATRELLCEHKGSGMPHYAHGLCESCYKYFVELSGGLKGGSEPPAFQRAEMERLMAKEAATDVPEDADLSTLPNTVCDKQRSIKNMNEYEDSEPADSGLTGNSPGSKVNFESNGEKVHESEVPAEESETLSDIDDGEVVGYLHTEEEKKLKKTIWEELNKEYLQEQAAKEAAEEAARKAYEASLANCSGDVEAAQKLAAAAAEAAKNLRKERKRKRDAEFKSLGPPKTAAEAARQELRKKGLSSKINYAELEKLFGGSEAVETAKKSQKDPESEYDENYLNKSHEDSVIEDNQDSYYDDVEQYNGYDEEYNYDDGFE